MKYQMYEIDTIQTKSGVAVSPVGNVMFNTHTQDYKVMTMPKDKISKKCM